MNKARLESGNLGGRPRIIKTPDDLQVAWDKYTDANSKDILFSAQHFCVWCRKSKTYDINSGYLSDLTEEFSQVLLNMNDEMYSRAIELGLNKEFNGAIPLRYLAYKFGMSDKVDQNITTHQAPIITIKE